MKQIHIIERVQPRVFVLYCEKTYSFDNYYAMLVWLKDNYQKLHIYAMKPHSSIFSKIWNDLGEIIDSSSVYWDAHKLSKKTKKLSFQKKKKNVLKRDGKYVHYVKEKVYFPEEGEMHARHSEVPTPFWFDDPIYHHPIRNWKKFRKHQYK